ncbi:carbohydrate ABC transporter permease [Romboutsia lituseburensis]|uniref:carbohydrate ABC transporter permease n=1 Tax=Romboutsia lituseburensis TaxID=1537 RepID=UPI00215A7AC2|nr:sugar ABC transporter permease [Romboutsia lituseburensis]MCR8744433.1 sugar ABC transporter permease [Romboutsia lituseburensis]
MEIKTETPKKIKNKQSKNKQVLKKSERQKKQGRFIFWCVVPTFLLFLLFKIYPMLSAAKMSLYRSTGLSSNPTFIGFENFTTLINDPVFWKSLGNTFFILGVFPIATMLLSLFFAVILTQGRIFELEKTLYRIVFFLPNILSMVVIGMLFMYVYDFNLGILNSFLDFAGLEALKRTWLGEKDTVLWALTFTMVWQAAGYYMVIYISGINRIPQDLYEAATLDGATPMKQFFIITLPLIWEVVRVTITFFITGAFNLSFIFVKVMTKGGPDNASNTLLNYMDSQAFMNANYGYAMAISVVVFVIAIVLAVIVKKITERDVIEF